MKTTACFICGCPCKFWSSTSANVCQSCAKKVYNNCDKSFHKDTYDPSGGDGFPFSTIFDVSLVGTRHSRLKELSEHANKIFCFVCGMYCYRRSEGYISVCSNCANKVHNYKTGSLSYVKNNFPSGDGFPPSWEGALLSARKDFIENKSIDQLTEADKSLNKNTMYNKQSTCFVCGKPCHEWSNDYHVNVCSKHAYQVHNYNDNGDMEEGIDESDYSNGDSFPSSYNDALKFVKNKFISEQKISKKGKMNMRDDGRSYSDIFVEDAGKAAIRSGATLGINGLKAGIAKALSHQGVTGPGAEAVMKFFEGKLGEALLRGGLGYGLLALPIPLIQENEYAQKLSEELRVSGLSAGMDEGMEMINRFIVPSLLESFRDTPLLESIMGEKPKPRVAESVTPKRVSTVSGEEIPVDMDEEVEPAKHAHA